MFDNIISTCDNVYSEKTNEVAMTVPNPLLTFTESEFTKGVFRAETKFGTVTLVSTGRDDKFSIFDPNGMSVDVGERRPFIDAVNRATFVFGG